MKLLSVVLAFICVTTVHSENDTGVTDGTFSVGTSGDATYTIPLACPPGTAGMQPSISLTYDSQAPTASLGIGWSIQGLSAVTRGPKNIQRDGIVEGVSFSKDDVFFLDGGRLIPIKHLAPDEIEYRNEVDNFARVIGRKIGANGPEQFEVWTKAGLHMQFGLTNNTRIMLPDGRLLLWACERITDTAGNYMEFAYESNGKGDYNISKIGYTGNPKAKKPYDQPYASISFQYESVASPTYSYLAGTRIVKERRLSRIISAYQTAVMRDYRLSYEATDSAAQFRLKSIQEFGADGRSFPPTQFTYSDSKPGWQADNFQPNIPLAYASGGMEVAYADIDQDGKTDLLVSALSGGHLESHTYLSTGSEWKSDDPHALPFPLVTDGKKERGYAFVELGSETEVDAAGTLTTIQLPKGLDIVLSTETSTGNGYCFHPPHLVLSGQSLARGFTQLRITGADCNRRRCRQCGQVCRSRRKRQSICDLA